MEEEQNVTADQEVQEPSPNWVKLRLDYSLGNLGNFPWLLSERLRRDVEEFSRRVRPVPMEMYLEGRFWFIKRLYVSDTLTVKIEVKNETMRIDFQPPLDILQSREVRPFVSEQGLGLIDLGSGMRVELWQLSRIILEPILFPVEV